MSVKNQKQGLMAKINVGRTQLHWDEDFYRQMLEEHGGNRSLRKMGILQMEKVLNHMMACGFSPSRKKRRNMPAPDRAELLKKIRAQLGNFGAGDDYAEGILRQKRGLRDMPDVVCPVTSASVEELQFLIARLDKNAERKGYQRK